MKPGLPVSSAPVRLTPSALSKIASSAALLSVLMAAGCSKEEPPPSVATKPATPAATPASPAAPGGATAAAPGKPTGPTPVNEADLPKIPILPGYKYYVGGPILSTDKYGMQRIRQFMDEVAQPPSRGMVFGAKVEGDKMEYTVWGNGRLLAVHRGTMRDGLFWPEYVEGYKKGKLVAVEKTTHNDETRRSTVITEEFDYETGESIRKRELITSYSPPVLPDDPDELDEEAAPDGATPKADAPAAPAAPGAATAPATPPAAPGAPAH